MSPETGTDIHRLAIAVERLAGEMNTGVATLRGDINVLATREHSNGLRIAELESDVEELKGRRFPLPTIGGLMGVAGVGISVIALFNGR